MRFVIYIFLYLVTYQVSATTWSSIYPYTQKTEKGKVKINSIPYTLLRGSYPECFNKYNYSDFIYLIRINEEYVTVHLF